MRSDASRRCGRDGFALVAVLAVTALLSSLLLGLSLWSRNAVENAAVASSDFRMDALLRSAATIAAYQLFVLKLPPAEVSGQRLVLDTGTATITVGDHSGKVDLNGAAPELLAAAYQASGLSAMPPAVFAARVVDWRDGDLTPSEGGAEFDAYQIAGLPPPRNGAFRTVSDLLSVLGVSERDIPALASVMTVSNPTGRLNPYEASLALLENLTGAAAASRSQLRTLLESPRSEAGDERMTELLTAHSALLDFDAPLVVQISIDGRLSENRLTKHVDVFAAASTSNVSPFHFIGWEEQPGR